MARPPRGRAGQVARGGAARGGDCVPPSSSGKEGIDQCLRLMVASGRTRRGSTITQRAAAWRMGPRAMKRSGPMFDTVAILVDALISALQAAQLAQIERALRSTVGSAGSTWIEVLSGRSRSGYREQRRSSIISASAKSIRGIARRAAAIRIATAAIETRRRDHSGVGAGLAAASSSHATPRISRPRCRASAFPITLKKAPQPCAESSELSAKPRSRTGSSRGCGGWNIAAMIRPGSAPSRTAS